MVKQMKLRGQLRLNMDTSITFLSTLIDGSPFECNVDIHDYEANEDFMPDKYVVDGWLYVVQEAKQHNRVYLTLPKPSLLYGKQVLVDEHQLQPRGVTLADFRPQKIANPDTVKQVKLENGQVVEVEGEASADAIKVLAEKMAEQVTKASKTSKAKKGSKS
jgi:hypothetical protein